MPLILQSLLTFVMLGVDHGCNDRHAVTQQAMSEGGSEGRNEVGNEGVDHDLLEGPS